MGTGFNLIATLVQTPKLGELEILHDQLISVDAKGFITAIYPESSPEAKTILSQNAQPLTRLPAGAFLLPTFVDLHFHAPQFLYLGTGLHLPLMQWLDQYAYKAEEGLDADPALAEKCYNRLAERLIEAGTGAILAFGTIKAETNLILARAFQAKGVRGFIGKLSMDLSSRPTYVEDNAKASLANFESYMKDFDASFAHLEPEERLQRPVITPRFVPTCSEPLLQGLGKLAKDNGVMIQSHLAEARDQVDWVRETRNAEDIDVFDDAGLLTDHTVQAHCTFLYPDDLSRMHTRGSGIAHCPLSNAYFSSQPFRLREALDAGVKVGLGTDVAGGYQVDIMHAMRCAVSTSRIREGGRIEEATAGNPTVEEPVSVDWRESLYLATRGGAVALNLETGVFEVGRPFDAQRIHLMDADGKGLGALDFFTEDAVPHTVNDEVLEKWWCIGDNRNRLGMWVQGRKVM